MSIQTERTNNQNFPMNRRSLLNKNWDQKLNTSKRTGLCGLKQQRNLV